MKNCNQPKKESTMTGWEALELARQDESIIITSDEISSSYIYKYINTVLHEYVYSRGTWVEEHYTCVSDLAKEWTILDCKHLGHKKSTPYGTECTVCELVMEKEPKMITWYRPEVICYKTDIKPYTGSWYYKSKEEYLKQSINTKVLKWETIEAPETWEHCK